MTLSARSRADVAAALHDIQAPVRSRLEAKEPVYGVGHPYYRAMDPRAPLLRGLSERFADGTPVDMTAIESRGRRPLGWLVDVRYRASDGAVRQLPITSKRAVAEEIADELVSRLGETRRS